MQKRAASSLTQGVHTPQVVRLLVPTDAPFFSEYQVIGIPLPNLCQHSLLSLLICAATGTCHAGTEGGTQEQHTSAESCAKLEGVPQECHDKVPPGPGEAALNATVEIETSCLEGKMTPEYALKCMKQQQAQEVYSVTRSVAPLYVISLGLSTAARMTCKGSSTQDKEEQRTPSIRGQMRRLRTGTSRHLVSSKESGP